MSLVSLGGCEYYLKFIYDHSKKTWIYFLRTKSEVFKRFQEFKALVENRQGQRSRYSCQKMGVSIPPQSSNTSTPRRVLGDN
jgi:hypothetical protein